MFSNSDFSFPNNLILITFLDSFKTSNFFSLTSLILYFFSLVSLISSITSLSCLTINLPLLLVSTDFLSDLSSLIIVSSFWPYNFLLGVSTDFGFPIKPKLIVLSDFIICWRSGTCSNLIWIFVISISPLFLLNLLSINNGASSSDPGINISVTFLDILRCLNVTIPISFLSSFSDETTLLLLLSYLLLSFSSDFSLPINSIFITFLDCLKISNFFTFNSTSSSTFLLYFPLLGVSTDLTIGFWPDIWILLTLLDCLNDLNTGISLNSFLLELQLH